MAANENLDKFFKKVDNHLTIEKVIIDDMEKRKKWFN